MMASERPLSLFLNNDCICDFVRFWNRKRKRQANEQGLKFEDGKTNSLDIAKRKKQNCLNMHERNYNETELTLSEERR